MKLNKSFVDVNAGRQTNDFRWKFSRQNYFLLVLAEQSRLGELNLQMLIDCIFLYLVGEETWKPSKKKSKPLQYFFFFDKRRLPSNSHFTKNKNLLFFLCSERLKIDNSVTQDEDDGGEMINNSVKFGCILLKHS